MTLQPLKTLKQGNQIYLDHNATTPVAQVVADKVNGWLSQWGNASSIHQSGRGPKTLIRESRGALSQMLDCQALEVILQVVAARPIILLSRACMNS